MPRLFALLVAICLFAAPLRAGCTGENLLLGQTPAALARLEAELARQPYPSGNFWRATRPDPSGGEQVLHLIGTYHLGDPRHDATMAAVAPLIASASAVLVEAGPDEETALKRAMATDPALLFITEGPSLLEQLETAEWQALAAAMKARGIPPFMAAKFKPWYVTMMLGIPPCAVNEVAKLNGLDHRVRKAADAAGVPVRALEPYDTLLKIFGALTPEEQLAMIRATLPFEDRAADYAATLADAYFAEDSRRVWEFMRLQSHSAPGYTPEAADAEYARMEEVLMSARNRNWLPVLEEAAARGPALAAFGALHLSGQDGVLHLLEQAGFTLTRLPL